VFLYAVGADHPLREPCRAVLSAMDRGELAGATSAAVVQEVAHVIGRRGDRARACQVAADVGRSCPVLDLSAEDIPLALELFERHDRLDGQDAFHAALAINRGLAAIVTPDRAFDVLDRLQRLDPAEAI
jgi:predicted nucleic acid-binding protein